MSKITYPDGSTPRICIVGAGFSGLCAAIQLKKQLGLTSFTIYDKNKDVGGTWLVNTYPGCACDVPSHLYSYSFEPNPEWTSSYSSQPEIWRYLKNVAEKHSLYSHIKFNTDVKSLVWDETILKWRVTIAEKELEEEQELLFDVVINGPGGLRDPKIPEEFKSFEGPLVHSAMWDSEVEIADKVVAVVGSGASAIQIIPAISSRVKELHSYQRKAAWVVERPQYDYHKIFKWIFAFVPFIMWFHRALIFLLLEFLYTAFKKDTYLYKAAPGIAIADVKKHLPENEELQKQLIPNYRFGCKRVLFSNNYYSAFTQPNVKIHSSEIAEIQADSIVTKDGETQQIDVLILATGFHIQDYFAPMKIVGTNSDDILTKWKEDGPQTFYGIATSCVPNHFILLGPNTALGHSSVVFVIECQVNFVMRIIKEMIQRNARSATMKASVEKKVMEEINEKMKTTVWGTSSCGSWYADGKGRITALYPGSCIDYWRKTRNADVSVFNYVE